MSETNESKSHRGIIHEEIPRKHNDPLIEFLHKVIRFFVKILAVLMVFVIIWGIGDVVYVLYQRLSTPPLFLLDINDIFLSFGAFMSVLIAIENFIKIRLYLGTYIFRNGSTSGSAFSSYSFNGYC